MKHTLAETVGFMNSTDYKERFIAEYYQTKIRYEKLRKLLTTNHAKQFSEEIKEAEPIDLDCPLTLLDHQLNVMNELLKVYEVRAKIEHIDLEQYE